MWITAILFSLYGRTKVFATGNGDDSNSNTDRLTAPYHGQLYLQYAFACPQPPITSENTTLAELQASFTDICGVLNHPGSNRILRISPSTQRQGRDPAGFIGSPSEDAYHASSVAPKYVGSCTDGSCLHGIC